MARGRNNVMVYYDWNDFGYSVEVADIVSGEEIEVYHAGNNRASSDVGDTVPPGTAHAYPRKKMREFAIKTAKGMCEDHKAFDIERDTKLRNDKQED